ncbi:hypothetical protein BRD00_11780 [Halobacteriales archaeon QS_8_69_26]|nr:MAG: hypothetical protein BRD00_11780 [Halobacteriales archaeon QS_8_69_26]
MAFALGLWWAESMTGLWPAVPVAVVVGSFLVAADRFGPPDRNLGYLAVAGVGVLGLLAMAVVGTVPATSLLTPLLVGAGVGIGAGGVYAVVRSERPA